MQPVTEAFGEAVAQCVHDADAEAVHRLRTGSRRLQAMLESNLSEPGPFEKPARMWLRQLKKIRRAAGPVRDLDVQRKLLEGWMGQHPLRVQAHKLDAWLKERRTTKAQTMQKQILKRRQRVEQHFPALRLADPAVQQGDALAIDIFLRAADTMPWLDGENLHDLRKAAKKARYVAEAGSAEPTSVAKALKRIQDAIGEWHDWLCLQRDAGKALGEDAPELTAAVEREVNRRFVTAIQVTESMRGRLLGEWLAMKRPGASAGIAHRRSA